MAGTITATTIQNDTSSPPTFRNNSVEIGRLCRAWVQFAGATGTINGSFNVSSVTRSGTGLYQINFTTAMPNANYAFAAGLNRGSGGVGNIVANDSIAYSTTALGLRATDFNATNIDPVSASISIFSS